ncbi:Ku domain-containing protein [Meloidogyne graminicola]|uniref:Large ribosomal subunit protein mL44 n=1 Tax=Meloidogyne graminicola TaxID=189291 RepID=A0A8S9ZZC4_9BILA|nr:Ku domain-containing protein [Meloidogyne graminicola]
MLFSPRLNLVLSNTLNSLITFNNFTAVRYLHVHKRWMQPLLKDLYNRRVMAGPEPLVSRSAMDNWNYTSEIFAFSHRIGIPELDHDAIVKALTNKSFFERKDVEEGALYAQPSMEGEYKQIKKNESNEELLEKGEALFRHILLSYLRAHWPVAPEEFIIAVAMHLASADVLIQIINHLGIQHLVRTGEFPPSEETLQTALMALLASIDVTKARNFVRNFILPPAGEQPWVALDMAAQNALLKLWKVLDEPRVFPFKFEQIYESRFEKAQRSNHSLKDICAKDTDIGIYSAEELAQDPLDPVDMANFYQNRVKPTLGLPHRKRLRHLFSYGSIMRRARRSMIEIFIFQLFLRDFYLSRDFTNIRKIDLKVHFFFRIFFGLRSTKIFSLQCFILLLNLLKFINECRQKKSCASIVLAIDVGSSSSMHAFLLGDLSVLGILFTHATDQFSLLFFGHECTTDDKYPNIYVHNAEFERSRVEWLHVLKNEIKSNPKCRGDYVAALFASLEQLKINGEVCKNLNTDATVTLISNFGGLTDDDQVFEVLDSVVDAINTIEAKLFIIGPDLMRTAPPLSKSQQLGIRFINTLNSKVELVSYNFQESLSKLSFFIPKVITPRGEPFNFELGKDFLIRVRTYIKNKQVKLERFTPVSYSSTSNTYNMEHPQALKKTRSYETVSDYEQFNSVPVIGSTPDTSFTSTSTLNKALPNIPSGKSVQKEDIVRGYRYGSTAVIFDVALKLISDIPREGKQLQLIQFVKKENACSFLLNILKYLLLQILPQFLLSSPRYILPHRDNKVSLASRESDQKSFNSFFAIVQAMINKGVFALCRYAYNKAANPKLACLVPKITKKDNYPILIHYLMPFRDDFRYFDFSWPLSGEITYYQKDLLDEYINNLMLCDKDGANELLKKRNILDPRIQYQYMILREKALNPGKPVELPFEDKRALLQMLEPPKHLLENSKHIISTMKNEFPLQLQINNLNFSINKEGNIDTINGEDETTVTTRPIQDNANPFRPILNTLNV